MMPDEKIPVVATDIKDVERACFELGKLHGMRRHLNKNFEARIDVFGAMSRIIIMRIS